MNGTGGNAVQDECGLSGYKIAGDRFDYFFILNYIY